MRVSIFLFESNVVLLEDIVVHAIEINSISNILELFLDTVKRVALLNEIFY